MTSGNQATVRLKYLRHSARKLEPILKQFRGRGVDKTIDQLAVYPQDSARFFRSALKSVRTAAEQKNMEPTELIITVAMATPGPKLKRSRSNARGRTNRFQKHLAHLTVSVGSSVKNKTKEGNQNGSKS